MSFKKIRIPLLILGLVATLVTGWLMYSKWQAEELWGHLPLWFFVGLWGTIVLSISFRTKDAEAPRLLGLSTLGGILLSLGFPPIPLTTLMFVGFVPLLLMEKKIADSRETPSKWRVFLYAYHGFVVWNILTTYWVANTAFFAGIFAIWVNSLFMSIPFVLFHEVKKRLPNIAWFSFVAFWLTFEYWHMHHELSWPWLTLGNSLAEFPTWAQWYEYTGVFGGSLWILLANVLFYKVISNYYFHKVGISFKNLIKPLALVILPILFSLTLYFTHEEKGQPAEFVVVQPNFEPHYEKRNFNSTARYERHLQLTKSTITENTDYVIFPESSFNSIEEKNLSKNRIIKRFKEGLKDYPKAKVIMGAGSYRFFGAADKDRPAIRIDTSRNGEVYYWEAYNTAFQFSNESDSVQVYHKSQLVPGAEFFPLKNVLPFMKPLVDKLGGSVSGFGMQPDRSVFTSLDGYNMAPVICYESIYGAYTLGYVRNGADALVVITNDGWWDDTAGHKQHLLYSALRAIETRRSVARSANTGISGFINQRGDIVAATQYEETIALNGTIQLNNEITFYTRYGDLIGRVSIFLSILLLLNLIAKTWLKRVKK